MSVLPPTGTLNRTLPVAGSSPSSAGSPDWLELLPAKRIWVLFVSLSLSLLFLSSFLCCRATVDWHQSAASESVHPALCNADAASPTQMPHLAAPLALAYNGLTRKISSATVQPKRCTQHRPRQAPNQTQLNSIPAMRDAMLTSVLDAGDVRNAPRHTPGPAQQDTWRRVRALDETELSLTGDFPVGRSRHSQRTGPIRKRQQRQNTNTEE